MGAHGYILKNAPQDHLPEAVQLLHAKMRYFSAEIAGRLTERMTVANVAHREHQTQLGREGRIPNFPICNASLQTGNLRSNASPYLFRRSRFSGFYLGSIMPAPSRIVMSLLTATFLNASRPPFGHRTSTSALFALPNPKCRRGSLTE